MRDSEMPVRGRKRPSTGLEACPCTNCGLRPGKNPFWGRSPEGEVLCVVCASAMKEQDPPKLVPRVCSNCHSTRSSLWVSGDCSACYHYSRKNAGAKRPVKVIQM